MGTRSCEKRGPYMEWVTDEWCTRNKDTLMAARGGNKGWCLLLLTIRGHVLSCLHAGDD